MLPVSNMYDGTVIESRVLDIVLGTGISYGIHSYMISGESGRVNVMNNVALIAATDFISEYITDYITTQPLSFLFFRRT